MNKSRIIPYREDLKTKARDLIKNCTLSDILLWHEIKEKKLSDFQFHRQVPILDFIVDFHCHELKLTIEIDGSSHNYNYRYDVSRQSEIEKHGIHFISFDDLEVKKYKPNVLRALKQAIESLQ